MTKINPHTTLLGLDILQKKGYESS